MRTIVLLLVVLLAACESDPVPTSALAPVAPTAPIVEGATQHDLARDLETAERDGDYETVVGRWQGRRVRWTVSRTAALCSAPDLCHVRPFPGARSANDAGHGWLPSLAMSPAEFAKIQNGCGTAVACDVVFEGRLARLDASLDDATELDFADVAVTAAAPARRL